jgi:hypothetical protein
VLVEREEVLHKAREDLAGACTIAAAWEAEVTSARAQLQQDHVTLEGVQAWQSQAKEAEGLRTTLATRLPRSPRRRSSFVRSKPRTSRSTSRSRGRKRPSSSGRTRPRSSTGSWFSSASH